MARLSMLGSELVGWTYAFVEDGKCDDPADLRQHTEDDHEEEEPDEAGRLTGATHPAHQPGEEQTEPQRDHGVGPVLQYMLVVS